LPNFWDENPWRPQWAAIEGRAQENPKQSGRKRSQLRRPSSCSGRDHVDIGGVEHAAGHGPPTLLDVALQPLELFRVVLLDQHVTEGTLEAQHKKWIALEVGEVSLQCCRQEVADGVLNRPPPLGVEVDGGDDVEMQGTARGLAIGPGHGSGVYDGRR
jgi:hypothetical protein